MIDNNLYKDRVIGVKFHLEEFNIDWSVTGRYMNRKLSFILFKGCESDG